MKQRFGSAVDDREQILAERERLRNVHGDRYDKLLALFFEEDPAGLNYDTNSDEYDPEVRTILPRLDDCRAPTDVANVIREEFVRWFGDDHDTAAMPYAQLAARVWVEVMEREPA